jgi:phosphoserine phosphatase
MIIDLDGTYIQGNTLHLFLRCALEYHLHRFHLRRLAGMLWYLGLRRLGRISHAEMKFRCLALAGRDATLLDHFEAEVRPLVHPRVESLRLEYERLGGLTLLATAAPDFYIARIWSGDFVATRMENNPWQRECRGAEKLRRVEEWLGAHRARMAVVITDHPDDLPLLRANSRGINYLVRGEEILPFREEEM